MRKLLSGAIPEASVNIIASIAGCKVEIREFFDSLVVMCKSGNLASYECTHERSQITSVSNTHVFHDHPEIKSSTQLELFDFSQFQLHYMSRRPPNRKHPRGDDMQLLIADLS